MNVAYKHLDSKLRIAELTIGAWIGVFVGVACGIGWGMYVSPFGPTLTLTLAIYVAALPIGAAVSASLTDFDPWLIVSSAIAWRRLEGRFVAGPGESARGYVVVAEKAGPPPQSHTKTGQAPEIDLASLWSES